MVRFAVQNMRKLRRIRFSLVLVGAVLAAVLAGFELWDVLFPDRVTIAISSDGLYAPWATSIFIVLGNDEDGRKEGFSPIEGIAEASLDVTVANNTDELLVLGKMSVECLAVRRDAGCIGQLLLDPNVGQPTVQDDVRLDYAFPSHTYELSLPVESLLNVSSRHELTIHQKVNPRSADRFSVQLSVDDPLHTTLDGIRSVTIRVRFFTLASRQVGNSQGILDVRRSVEDTR